MKSAPFAAAVSSPRGAMRVVKLSGEKSLQFEQVMSSLKVTREDAHAKVKLAIELCGALREAYPDQDYRRSRRRFCCA